MGLDLFKGPEGFKPEELWKKGENAPDLSHPGRPEIDVGPIVEAIKAGFAGIQVNLPQIQVPEIKLPDIALPDWNPQISLPELKIPEIDVSGLTNVISQNMEIFTKKMVEVVSQIEQRYQENFRVLGEVFGIISGFLQMAYPIVRTIASSMDEWNSLQERMKASGQDLSAPNLDPVLVSQVVALMAVPGVGQMVRGAVNYAQMSRYQKLTGRGFASDLDQLYWLVNGPGGAAASGLDQAVSKIPAFFLK